MGMQAHAESLLSELDVTLAKSSGSQQLIMLRKLTDLFLAGAPNYSTAQIAIFEVILNRLTQDIDPRALVELSGRLANLDNAPPELISRLSSSDDIKVSGPVLEKSTLLDDHTLVGVAKTKSQNHLMAIAGRIKVNEPVTDVLVDRGSPAVRCKVIANAGALFSEEGFARLVTEAGKDKTLAGLIAERPDVPAELQPFLDMLLGKAAS